VPFYDPPLTKSYMVRCVVNNVKNETLECIATVAET